jgi:hypothetical protein
LVVVGCSLFRGEPPDEIGIAVTPLWLATCWHGDGDGVECLVLGGCEWMVLSVEGDQRWRWQSICRERREMRGTPF